MTKRKPKKPTLNEVRQVVENLIHDLTIVNSKVDSIATVTSSYFEWKNDDKAFLKHLQTKQEKKDDKQGTVNKDSK